MFAYKFLCEHIPSFTPGIFLVVEWLGPVVTLFLTFWGTARLSFGSKTGDPWSKCKSVYHLPFASFYHLASELHWLLTVKEESRTDWEAICCSSFIGPQASLAFRDFFRNKNSQGRKHVSLAPIVGTGPPAVAARAAASAGPGVWPRDSRRPPWALFPSLGPGEPSVDMYSFNSTCWASIMLLFVPSTLRSITDVLRTEVTRVTGRQSPCSWRVCIQLSKVSEQIQTLQVLWCWWRQEETTSEQVAVSLSRRNVPGQTLKLFACTVISSKILSLWIEND